MNKNYITDEVYQNITKHNSPIPKAYGLPKIHKDGVPIRIIVASYESPAHEISAYFAKILKILTINSKYNIKNSFELVSKLTGITLDHDELLTSYNVKSLFTNVSVDYALDAIDERWNEIEMVTPIPKEDFFRVLNFILRDCNQFKYGGKIYKQLHDTPMGLPLSQILAEIVMEKILDLTIPTFNFVPKVFVKYVDNMFTIVPRQFAHATLECLNAVNNKIQFTNEENRYKLPYLDVTLMKGSNGQIDTKWYSKPSASNRLLNFHSSHPFQHKLNVMDNLIKRVYGLSPNTPSNQNWWLGNGYTYRKPASNKNGSARKRHKALQR